MNMHADENSDGVIVPEKRPNKEGLPSAEAVEGRTPPKGNGGETAAARTLRRDTASNGLIAVRRAARQSKSVRFTALLHHITIDLLKQSYLSLERDSAPGIDGVTWQTYGENLEEKLKELHDKVHRGSYRARPARRTYIPKADGSRRPLRSALSRMDAPRGSTPEDELLVQFQGMIAEYERAQILERSRRGKRHRARQGEVSVLSGAPFGYRFIRKTDHSAAYYQINEEQARVVRWMFELYSVQGLSIGAIARLLNEQAIPTCKRRGRWERSTVWGMLRNPAYKGQACFGKTTIAPRQRITRPIRMRGGIATRNSASHERPRGDWITIAVPPIVSEEIFALAQERLETNKTHAPRRTVTPSVVQGLVSCSKCGYALYRTSTRSSARKIHYYRCLGSDAYRHLGKFICDNRPVRQDLLDEVVWTEIVRLLEDPQLLQCEIDRRLAAARKADPTKRREEALRRELVRIRRSIDRLLTAYQEGLLSLDELRERMPNLRRREQGDNAELQAIVDQSADRATYLRLAETLTTFLTRLRSSADALDVSERQHVLRLLVKEILVGDDKIIIRHSIPLPAGPADCSSADHADTTPARPKGYLLRPRSHLAVAREHLPARCAGPMVRGRGETTHGGGRYLGAICR